MFLYLEQCNHGVVFLGIDVLLSNMFKDFGFVERGRNFTRQRAEIFHSVEMTKRQNMLLVRSMVMPFEKKRKKKYPPFRALDLQIHIAFLKQWV